MSHWITAVEFGELAGIERQVANRICRGMVERQKTTWRDAALAVRVVKGRGGRSGKQYQVKISSLPLHLQDRLKALQTTDEALSKVRYGDAAQLERNWKLEVISAALAHEKRSPERKAEVERLHHTRRLDWRGKPLRLARTTIYQWIQAYEHDGIHALASKVRLDKGEKRVFFSRAWSTAVPFDDEVKASIAEDILQFIRGMIAQGMRRKITQHVAAGELRRVSAAYGFIPNSEEHAAKVFAVPDAIINAELKYRKVYLHNNDRKASEDSKPRIKRTIKGLAPMEVVVMDVHHVNVMVLRENGTSATPKFLAFHDVATNRVYGELVFLNERGGVRNVDVIEAFKRMCQDPAFGLPQTLYCDNGSEYGFADYLEDALKLNCRYTPFTRENRSRVIRAIAYNASAKVVEGFFRQINQQYLRHVPGWIDDDRMNAKQQVLGRSMPPYAEGFQEFARIVAQLLTTYENMPQRGALKGKSPAQVFRGFVEQGWAATVIDEADFYLAFAKSETRTLRNHVLMIGGRSWTCKELRQCHDPRVKVRIPAYHGYNELLVETLDGKHIGWATPSEIFEYLDPRGAETSAAYKKEWRDGIRQLEASVPKIDALKTIIQFGANAAPVIPNPPSATVSYNVGGSKDAAIVPSGKPSTRAQREAEQRLVDEARKALVAAAMARRV